MTYDQWSGDPRITITPNGADFTYRSGQPVMDQGVGNQLVLALFTRKKDPRTGFPWCGNVFLQPRQRVGSDFLAVAEGVLTISTVTQDIPNAAKAALDDPIFAVKSVDVTNPVANYVKAQITVGVGDLTIKGNRDNWQAEYMNPASRRL
jgi:hypothetical protein